MSNCNLKKGDIVIRRDSVVRYYKTYYLILEVEGPIIRCRRCDIGNNATYIYNFNVSEVLLRPRFLLEETNYIRKQLEANEEKISNGDPFRIRLRHTVASENLIRDPIEFKILSLFARDRKEHVLYEIKRVLKSPRDSISKLHKDLISNVIIELLLGRKFATL